VLDHIPPLFGCRSFDEMVSNRSWSQADKSYVRSLSAFPTQAHDALRRQIAQKNTTWRSRIYPQGPPCGACWRRAPCRPKPAAPGR